jgi:plasmid stability protein
MARTITIRNLDAATQKALRHRAVDHGVSFEAELRSILRRAAQEAEADYRQPEPVVFSAAARFREATRDLGAWSVERTIEYPDDEPFE